ncbi:MULTISPECIES: phosphoribosylformylglycinamidine cyclo-ligase [Metabacillus]|uniref:Phosphoribosylformylglycinamidine cyclo-ligase n=1 Tax=Metabacillus hrfriensis TaxID=3048891 RepID=A0ACD4RCC1_9BACI|nr:MULTISPECIES: phosphoribosylformylglycinamidine cyclo-ligase [Metabacillus]UAL52604.1 phosphoribosylformylglycinamidine cyclo-ligase [Metabacillus dongyingensis]UOK58282.1 phosphoribosylformylglycinamidine cyclo-ligase [Bacillus sp. OVS6]WHZ58138.1 phosphoribosylformylglycinamidine cyclo-ligase [Metabacillus sp. CT-WN-B3]
MSNAYKQAGVDIEAGYEAVSRMKKHVAKTMRKGVMGSLGGFGGMFDLSELNYKQPVLVSGTDGVGTKLKLAFLMDQHDTIGIDAVAMCVNDILAQGAEPLFFLDYLALGKAEPVKIEQIVKGVADGCEQSGCALVGGETAEMPGLYDGDEYDIAGFAVGAVEKEEIVTGENIRAGHVLIGLSSSGLHSNGFSLVRKILLEDNGLSLKEKVEPLQHSLGEELLRPTKIYVKPVLEVLKKYKVDGMAHITGGGFIENIPRMLPEGLGAEIDYGSWPIPPVFDLLQEKGTLSQEEMFNIFNMGIGFVLAVDYKQMHNVINEIEKHGEKAYIIGRVKDGQGVTFGGGSLT